MEAEQSHKEIAVGAFGSRVEYEITQSVSCEFREGVATFVFAVKEHNRRVAVPAEAYLEFLEALLEKVRTP